MWDLTNAITGLARIYSQLSCQRTARYKTINHNSYIDGNYYICLDYVQRKKVDVNVQPAGNILGCCSHWRYLHILQLLWTGRPLAGRVLERFHAIMHYLVTYVTLMVVTWVGEILLCVLGSWSLLVLLTDCLCIRSLFFLLDSIWFSLYIVMGCTYNAFSITHNTRRKFYLLACDTLWQTKRVWLVRV